MKRIGIMLFALLALTIGSLCRQNAPTEPQLNTKVQEAQWYDATRQKHQQQAVFASSRQGSRIANNRPQRLLPTQGTRQERPLGKLPVGNARWHLLSHFKQIYGQCICQLSAPCRPCLTRNYYVITLRHILR